MHRGGGAQSGDALRDWRNALNCSRLCREGMQFGCLGNYPTCPNTNPSDPYYLRCWDLITPTPLNGIRTQFASQDATMEVDPTLIKMNVTDVAACLGMLI